MKLFDSSWSAPLLAAVLVSWNVLQQYQINFLRRELLLLQDMEKWQSVPSTSYRRKALAQLDDLSAPSPPAIKGIKTSKLDPENDYKFYGGKGDKPHLGGFTYVPDHKGVSHNLWKFMLGELAIKSLVDLGCGMGVSTSWFLQHGVDVLCVEGSSDAIKHTRLPLNKIVEHDFTLGPWWPGKTYDAVWCVEFLEHVGRHYMTNYVHVLNRAALIFVTSAGYGGHHHVEIHEKWWWRGRLTAFGFVFAEDLTDLVKRMAAINITEFGEAEHLKYGLDVFINPRVAALPQHQHLFGGNGCFGGIVDNRDGGKVCTGADALPKSFEALLDCSRNSKGFEGKGKAGGVPWRQIPLQCAPNLRLK